MKLSTIVVTATAATCLFAGHGLAQAPTSPAGQPSVAQKSDSSMSDSMMGGHTMDGTVTKVDAKRGWVDVKTPKGRMKLHFPRPALDNVKVGDAVSVELGLRK